MDNLLQLLRLQNIFAPMNPIEPQPMDEIPRPEPQNIDPLNLMDIYQPEHRMSDRMMSMLDQFPQRQKPSFMRKLVASMAGAGGGLKAADYVLDDPFNDALGDWKAQFDPIADAANQERYANSNMRILANNMLQRQLQERDIERKEHKDEETARYNNERLEIQRKRADAYDFKQRHPNWLPVRSKGGTVKFYNPQDPSQIVDTGLDQGTMTDMDRINLLGEQRMEQIGAQQAGATERTGMVVAGADERNEESIAAANERARLAQEGANARNEARINAPSKASSKGRTQADIEKEIANRARKLASEHPEWKRYIEFDRTNRFKGITAPGYIFGPDQKTHDDIYRALYGEGPTNEAADKLNKTQTNLQPGQSIPPAGWIRVRSKATGKTGKLLLKDYDPSKYEKIQ